MIAIRAGNQGGYAVTNEKARVIVRSGGRVVLFTADDHGRPVDGTRIIVHGHVKALPKVEVTVPGRPMAVRLSWLLESALNEANRIAERSCEVVDPFGRMPECGRRALETWQGFLTTRRETTRKIAREMFHAGHLSVSEAWSDAIEHVAGM